MNSIKLNKKIRGNLATALGRLRGAFKIDLLTLLVRELSGEDTEIDVVDVCHLLVTMCTKNTADAMNEKSDTASRLNFGRSKSTIR